MMNKTILVTVLIVLLAFGGGYIISQSKEDAPVSTPSNTESTSPSDKSLDMSGKQLTSLSDDILSQTGLTSLNISNNQLVALPASIANMTSLELLNVENNRLESLPTELSQLKNLREIRANNNRMTSIPNELGTMTWLTVLDISGNSIPSEQIDQLRAKLTNTEVKS